MKRFNNTICLITGGSSGIGRGVAIGFAKEGSFVVITDIQEHPKTGKYHETDLTTTTLEEVKNIGGNGIFIRADISSEQDITRLTEKIRSNYGKLDILVNNAGIHIPGSIEELSIEDWDKVIGLNLRGVFYLSKNCIGLLKESGRGRIIHIASIHALGGGAGPAYAPAKAGILNLTKDMSIALGKYGITVNAICPGYIETPIQDYLKPEEIKSFKETLPIKRLGKPKDIANAALFLASAESEWITGTSLVVDGGGIAGI